MQQPFNLTKLALLTALATCLIGHAQAAKWHVQPIVDPAAYGMQTYRPTGLNNSGAVVGIKEDSRWTGFVTGANGVGFQSLGPVLFMAPRGLGIDDAGEVAGTNDAIPGSATPFISAANSVKLTSLPVLPGTDQNYLTAFSSDGRALGVSGTLLTNPGSASPPQLRLDRTFITGPHGVGLEEWTAPSGYIVQPVGINKLGQIIVDRVLLNSFNATTNRYNTRAMLTGPDASGLQDLGTLGGDSSTAAAINDVGQVVGSSQVVPGQTDEHAFLSGPNGTPLKDLGHLGGGRSTASGVNNLGQVVGLSYPSAGASDPAVFVTGPNGEGMRNLTQEVPLADNATLNLAVAINDKGQVLARDTNYQIYLLTPLPDTPTSCTVTYKVTKTGFGLFQAQVDVSNLSGAALSNWQVSWRYSARPVLLSSNAKIVSNGTAVTLSPKVSNKTVAARASISLTLTGTTVAGKPPTVSGLSGTLGGSACDAVAR